MKDFILIDTWNGSGYSDSSAEIIKAETIEEAFMLALSKHDMSAYDRNGREKRGDFAWCYGDGEDDGVVRVIEYKGQAGIELWPDVNSYASIERLSGFNKRLDELANKAIEPDEATDLREDGEGGVHSNEGYRILVRFDERLYLEYVETKDDRETYVNKFTGEKVVVETEIIRHWSKVGL